MDYLEPSKTDFQRYIRLSQCGKLISPFDVSFSDYFLIMKENDIHKHTAFQLYYFSRQSLS